MSATDRCPDCNHMQGVHRPPPEGCVGDARKCPCTRVDFPEPASLFDDAEPEPESEPEPEPEPVEWTEDTPNDLWRLGDVRKWVRERADTSKGVECPTCEGRVKVYWRHVNASMARDLIIAFRKARRDWFHQPTVLPTARGGDFTKMRYWDLIEPMPGERADGSTRTGWWRITDEGEEWLRGRTTISHKFARVLIGQVLGMETTNSRGEPQGPWGVQDALADGNFNYRELMEGL